MANKKAKYEVAIVGAGPAGLAAALTLALKGIKSLVLEQSKEFGHKACGEAIGPESFGFSARKYLTAGMVKRQFDRVVGNFEGKEFVLKAENSLFGLRRFPTELWLINRKRLEESLAEKSTKAGAKIRLGVRVNSLERVPGGILVNKQIKTEFLIGADGFNSIVRQFLGLKRPKAAFAINAEAETNFCYPTFFFGQEIIAKGFAWIFPKAKTCNVGIGSLDHQIVKPAWEKFSKRMGFRPKNFRGAFVTASLPGRTYFDHCLLTGEAAGLVDPFTAAGISLALMSGELAGKVALEALREDKFEADFLKKYEDEWRRRAYPDLLRGFFYQKVFYGFLIHHKNLTSLLAKWLL